MKTNNIIALIGITSLVIVVGLIATTDGTIVPENKTVVKTLDMNLINQSGLQGAIVIHKGNDVYLQQGNLIVKVTK